MSDQNVETTEPTELELLKQRANVLGIKFNPQIGLEKLKARIQEMSKESAVTKDPQPTPTLSPMAQARKDASQLVRIRVSCMNPDKRDWKGEIFTVSNSVVGTMKKYVPFNAEQGWHIPTMMYNVLKERQYTVHYTTKDAKGHDVKRTKLVPEFSIEVLTPLTGEELKALAQRQTAAERA